MKEGDIERRTKEKTGKMGKTIRKTELFCRVHRRIRKMAVGYRLKRKRKEKLRRRKNSFRSCVLCGLCRWERTRLARQIRRRCSSLITLQAAKTGFCRYSQFALPCSEWEAADFPHCRDKQQARHRLNIISYLYTSRFLFTPFFLFRDGTLPKLSFFP